MILHTARDRYRRTTLKVATTIAASVFFAAPSVAETWSDASGKFTIEADYAGVKGADLVLRKPDGTTLNVPINRLSTESRNQAKRLYEAAKKAGSTPPTQIPSNQATSTYQPAAMELTFTPPEPPEIAPMPAFPVGASLQETVDFVRGQAMAGHLEVFWVALPDDLRTSLDSQDMRAALKDKMAENATAYGQISSFAQRILGILVNKKQYILNTPMLAQVPTDVRQKIDQGYDPGVGVLFEYLSLMGSSEKAGDVPMSEFFGYHLPRLGSHMAQLVKLAPPEATNFITNGIVVTQTGAANGTLRITDPNGKETTVDMTVYNQRWLPSDLAKKWEADRDTFVQAMIDQSPVGGQDEVAAKKTQDMITGMLPMFGLMIAPLEAAQTQQEFDTAVQGIAGPLMGMMGGPGGPPGGPGF